MSLKYVLFGASKLGSLAYEYLKDNHDIRYYGDNATNKIGKKLNGLEIISEEKILNLVLNQDFSVIISSQYYKEIGEQLLSKGIDKKKIKVFYNKLEYLQTIEDIEDKKKSMKDLIRIEELKYNRNIFSEYNVHLMFDSIYNNTFIETTNKEYDKKDNLFIIFNNSEKIKYIDINKHSNIVIINSSDYSFYSKLHTYIYGSNKLFIHFLSDQVCEMLDVFDITKLPCEINWILWGADLYSYIDFNMYGNKTYEFIKNKDYYINAEVYRRDVGKLDIRRDIIRNVDYILTVNKGDYDLVIENFETGAKLKKFSYNINIDFEELDKIKKKKDQSLREKLGFKFLFLLGNSATWENNHLEAFYKLKSLDLQDFGVILPLSYGDKSYAKDIINEGRKILGDRLIVLDKFMDVNAYYTIINQVDAVIMNHIRQQAGGNVAGAIYLGKQVYMNKKSNLYKLQKERNLEVYCIEELCEEKLMQGEIIDLKRLKKISEKIFKNNSLEVLG